MRSRNNSLKSILLVDDNQDSLDLYSGLLKRNTKAHIMCTKFPSEALKWANKYFFDIILIDVTMNYNGSQFGGLEVYKNLKGRYGDASLIVYSQYITDDLLKQYEYEFNFIEKEEDPQKFIRNILKLMDSLRKRQSCFVAMPFSSDYIEIYDSIKKIISDNLYKCIRIDQQIFTQSIIEKIFLEIEHAKFIVFVATDQNPNAFYECGYSVALKKEVITVTDTYENLPFDIRDRNAISYNKKIQKLSSALQTKINRLTKIFR